MQSCYLCGSNIDGESPLERSFEIRVKCPVCGIYVIEDLLIDSGLIEKELLHKHLLIGLVRQASDSGHPIKITTENFYRLLDSAPKFSSPLDILNLTLILIMQNQKTASGYVQIRTHLDYPLVYAHNADEFYYLIHVLKNQELIEFAYQNESLVRLTPKGWTQGLELQKTKRNSNQAFVAMSFAKELNEAWESGIKKALESTGFRAYRVDQEEYNEKIDDRIVSGIRQSGLLVADFTGHRQGVYFEAGFAMGLGIPVIYTCKNTDIDSAHFDTRQYNHIVWSEPSELNTKLSLRISATIPNAKVT